MQILLAAPRGFCAGVNMAIRSLQMALARFGPPVYVYHEIVHNKWVVEGFQAQGAVFVNDLEAVPEGAHVVFSAHGVSPAVRQQAARRRLHTIDATCPLVTKVHHEAVRLAAAGYTIILIGHAGHDEVVATMGEAPESTVLVSKPEDVDRLELPTTAKLAYLTQTTLSLDDAAAVIQRLRRRFPGIVGPPSDDVCYATQNRQAAIRELAPEADLVLVVGSRNSSNSQRLVELAQACGVPAYLIDGPADIDPQWFSGVQCVVITAGASAPESVVQQCVDHLRHQFNATVQMRSLRPEKVQFALPRELRAQPESSGGI